MSEETHYYGMHVTHTHLKIVFEWALHFSKLNNTFGK